jgi:citrate lyase subunit beta/citryl-CoA lyase
MDGPMRSYMFVPAHRPRMIERALGHGEFGPSGLDVAILDLEDGVPPGEKAAARGLISTIAIPTQGTRVYVRVNGVGRDDLRADLEAAVRAGVAGIVVPKVERIDEIAAVVDELRERERRARVDPVVVVASVESARAVLAAPAIAAHERVSALLFGAEDFARDLALPAKREAEAADLLYARSAVVVAAVASRRYAIDGIWPDIADEAGLRRDALTARRLGFAGKSLIHPRHIPIVNEAFTTSDAELADARRIVDAFEDARRKGLGAVALDGRLLDQPVVDRARRTIERSTERK